MTTQIKVFDGEKVTLTFGFIVNGKPITQCIGQCPYQGDDGGHPGPVMACEHPQLAKEGLTGYDTCIINDIPEDFKFPKKCPLRRILK